jgi:hypothetical protein
MDEAPPEAQASGIFRPRTQQLREKPETPRSETR